MIITRDDIAQFEQRYRTAFVNSLAGFRQAVLVGTKSRDNNSNLAIFNSLIHLGANPALLGLINRPDSEQRDTLQNIIETKEYTLNYVRSKEYEKAHQTSARYDKEISEFEITGLTPEYKDAFFAPYVTESNIQLGIEFKEKIDLTINNTILIIGEITQIYIPENCLSADGFVDIEKANTVTCSGLDSYHKTVQLDRLSYAKPNKEVSSILKIE
jgi:flavin reductase (DIM6/NTAB) family NADH-FMN oxidoreductase RutF